MVIDNGMVVTLDFELRDAQGEIIQEHGGDPIVYLHGGEFEVFPKLQEELAGCKVGDEVYVQLEPEDAFGDYDPDLIRIEDLERFPEGLALGMQLEEVPVDDEAEPDEQATDENTGFGRMWTVTEMADGKVVLDGNHPLAGLAIRYHIIVKEIREGTEEEKLQGAAAQSMFSVAEAPFNPTLH